MGFASQRGQRGRDLGQAGADVGRRRAHVTAAVGVAGVGLGYCVAEVALTGRERITNHAEYLSRSGKPWRLLPGGDYRMGSQAAQQGQVRSFHRPAAAMRAGTSAALGRVGVPRG
jgi:hypothetical protein